MVVTAIDRRVPVRLLNLALAPARMAAAETLTGRTFDVTHSPHPLLLPSRAAAQVVTIHDLSFLDSADGSRADVRRDYPALVHAHAARADRIVVSSRYAAGEVARRLDVPPREDRALSARRAVMAAAATRRRSPDTCCSSGTIEPRKNVGALLDAYERTPVESTRTRPSPELRACGQGDAAAQAWLDRLERPPLRGVVRHLGYVDADRRRALYEGARLLVLPSLDEGFGLPVLEAMTTGVPVVAANRGALPEVVGDAGPLIDPERPRRSRGRHREDPGRR